MPITGKIVYHLRWWYRATVADDAPVQLVSLEAPQPQLIAATATAPTEALPIASKK